MQVTLSTLWNVDKADGTQWDCDIAALTSPLLVVDMRREALLAGVFPFGVQARKVGDAQDNASGSYI